MSMTLPKAVLERFVNPVFIETGTHEGLGVRLARSVGFQRIHSIEIDPGRYNVACNLFQTHPGIKLHLGDSRAVLPGLLSGLKERATFWLDAHPLGDFPNPSGTLVDELRIIAASGRRDHTILIDDKTAFDRFGTSDHEVRSLLLSINEDYRFFCFDSGFRRRDIVVAEAPV